MKNYITFSLLKIFSIELFFIPRRLSIALAKLLGALLYYLIPFNKKVIKINLEIAFPKFSKKEQNKLILKTYKHYCIILVEFLRQKYIKINKNLLIIDKETEKILNQNKNFILVTAHIGNWEIFLPIISPYRKIAAIVRKQDNLGGDKFITNNRTYDNVRLISNKDSVSKMYKALTNEEVLLILNDQKPKKSGTIVNFFGEPTLVPKGAGHFYYKTKCPIVVGFCILQDDYKYQLKLRKININASLQDKDDIINEINTIYSNMLEEEIIKNPDQYCWFYKKWDRSLYPK